MPNDMLTTKDHDLLIKLDANFETFLKQYHLDVKELKDGTSKQLADHEVRLAKLESITAEVKPVETVKEFRDLQKQVNDFFVSANTARWFVGSFSGILASVVTVLILALLKNAGIVD